MTKLIAALIAAMFAAGVVYADNHAKKDDGKKAAAKKDEGKKDAAKK